MTSRNNIPEYVTFTAAADLLVRCGLAQSMTPQGLRYLARTRDDWPFGDEEDREPYLLAHPSSTRLMRTKVFLDFFRKHPPTGRGPDKKPRERPNRGGGAP